MAVGLSSPQQGCLAHLSDSHRLSVFFCFFFCISPLSVVPIPPSGELRITDVTHSTMQLDWDAAPGAVRKYIITYKPEEGELKEVRSNSSVKFAHCNIEISHSCIL